jgi:hypothetical protein
MKSHQHMLVFQTFPSTHHARSLTLKFKKNLEQDFITIQKDVKEFLHFHLLKHSYSTSIH